MGRSLARACKQWKIIKLPPQKEVAVAYERFQLKDFVFWIDDRLQEMVAHGGSTCTRGKRRRESFPRHLGHFFIFIYLVIERFDCW